MIEVKRFGIRADGNPVIEASTYLPAAPDHPLAVELPGHDGFWVRIAVGNSFSVIGAKPVTEAEYNQAANDIREIVERNEQEARLAREIAAEELATKRLAALNELAALGLSQTTIQAILDQTTRQG